MGRSFPAENGRKTLNMCHPQPREQLRPPPPPNYAKINARLLYGRRPATRHNFAPPEVECHPPGAAHLSARSSTWILTASLTGSRASTESSWGSPQHS